MPGYEKAIKDLKESLTKKQKEADGVIKQDTK